MSTKKAALWATVVTAAFTLASGGLVAAGAHHGRSVHHRMAVVQLPTAHLSLDVLPGFKLGPDGKRHDAFSPSTLTVAAGQRVVLTVYNWDNMQHSFTSASLHVNTVFAPSSKNGAPSITTITFTAPSTRACTHFSA
ncbi:MAG: cupredoxin domain-containing protein [Firmicutes bacterium]|nr:cupredoxin domain-containing protein [Bacillota bacterium]